MDNPNSLIRPVLIVLFLAIPAVMVRVWSHFSDDPYLQPLHITAEGLAAVGEGRDGDGFEMIDVQVGWGRDWAGAMTRDRLRDVISAALDSQTEFYRFDFQEGPGDQIEVNFVVGANRYGPYPPGGMIEGVNAALIALRLTNGPGS